MNGFRPIAGSTGQPPIGLPQRPAAQAAIGIHRAVSEGRERISLKLYPAELGRIDVRIEIADDGVLRAVIAAEKPETLDLMQRDVRALERLLQNAGLKTDSGSLTFEQGGGRQGAEADARSGFSEDRGPSAESLEENELAAMPPQGATHDGLLDLSV